MVSRVTGWKAPGLTVEFFDVDLDRGWLQEWIDALGVGDWPLRVVFADARHKRELYMQEFDGEYPGDANFRAFVERKTKSGTPLICIFKDQAENEGSLLWLLIHELAHYNILSGKMSPLAWYFGAQRDRWLEPQGITPEEYVDSPRLRTQDHFHEAEPEERFVNDVATTIVGNCHDRTWWRARLKEIEEAA